MKEKQIQISQKLFITLVKCFVLDMEVDCEEIKKELNRKLDAVALRQLYSTYKTAPTDAEKEDDVYNTRHWMCFFRFLHLVLSRGTYTDRDISY